MGNVKTSGQDARVLALIGANGMLARKVAELAKAAYQVHGFDLPEFDLADESNVRTTLNDFRPDVIINCAAYNAVDDCESNADHAFLVNGRGPGLLAEEARKLGATLVHFSTDYVFDGNNQTPYLETDRPVPLSVYGRSKFAGEESIIESGHNRYFIIRTSWLYGPGGGNFVETIVRLAKEREELRVIDDQIGSPTYTGDLAQAALNLLDLEIAVDREELPLPGTDCSAPVNHSSPYGIYHFSNDGVCSWHGFAEAIVAAARNAGEPIVMQTTTPIAAAEYPMPASRPAYSVLNTDKYHKATGAAIPGWQDSLEYYFSHDRS